MTKLTGLPSISVLTGDELLYVADDTVGSPTNGLSRNATPAVLRNFSNMAYSAYSADANLAAVVNTFYFADISGFAADRTLTLPATAAVGDCVGLFLTVGDTAFEFLITATAGDTLNGVAGGTEWSRLFIANECVVLRCIVANTTWVVERDDRIAQVGMMELTTNGDGNVANTYVRPTQCTSVVGVWTARIDNASLVVVASDAIFSRRAGNLQLSIGYGPKDAGTVGNATGCRGTLNGATEVVSATCEVQVAGVNRSNASKLIVMAAGDYIQYAFRTTDADIGIAATPGVFMALAEVLR